jgi:flagellar FliJ protein
MTRSHEPLIRLARFKVEELQKQMAELDRSKAALNGQIERLEASVPEEQAAATDSKEGYVAYGSYAQAVIKRKENIRLSLSEVEVQADALRDRLSEAFQELKKYEVLEERRLSRAQQALRTAEQEELDEIAQIRHHRSH